MLCSSYSTCARSTRAWDAPHAFAPSTYGCASTDSAEPRTTLLIQMRDPEDRALNDRHSSRGQGMMLAGIDPTAKPFTFAWDEKAA